MCVCFCFRVQKHKAYWPWFTHTCNFPLLSRREGKLCFLLRAEDDGNLFVLFHTEHISRIVLQHRHLCLTKKSSTSQWWTWIAKNENIRLLMPTISLFDCAETVQYYTIEFTYKKMNDNNRSWNMNRWNSTWIGFVRCTKECLQVSMINFQRNACTNLIFAHAQIFNETFMNVAESGVYRVCNRHVKNLLRIFSRSISSKLQAKERER